MGSYLATQNNDLNILISDSDNDDFYTKFLVKDTHLIYSFKNTVNTTHPSINVESELYKKINNIYKINTNTLTLDNNNDLVDIPKYDFDKFTTIINNQISHLKDEVGYEINIIIDYSCYKFLQFIIDYLDNDVLHPQKINILLINNLTNNSLSRCNNSINDILNLLYIKSKKINASISYRIFDYRKAIGVKSTIIQKPIYGNRSINNIIGHNNISNLLVDYYTEFHFDQMPLYIPIISIIEKTDFKLVEYIKNSELIKLKHINYYKFDNNDMNINTYLSNLLIELIKKINVDF